MRCPNAKTTICLYLGLCIFRILNTFLVQSFFDPDEYWQTLEPAYCEVFLKPEAAPSPFLECAGYTWEYKRRQAKDTHDSSWLGLWLEGPIRSYFSILPTYLFYLIIKKCRWDTHFWVSQGPKIVSAVFVAAPTDLTVWIMAHWIPDTDGKNQKLRKLPSEDLPWWCLFCSVSSWFNGYALIRTYSNSLETMLLCVSMALVAPELLGNSQMPCILHWRYSLCFFLGGLSCAMRFSGIAAWIPVGVILALHLCHCQQSSTWLLHSAYFLIKICAVFGALGIVVACAVDRFFYGFWTVPFLGSFHFNVILGHSSLYGSHPWHWYLTSGVPALSGILLPFLIWDLKEALVSHDGMRYARQNLWIIIAIYTAAHSMSEHKEFRFLMPVLPCFCLLSGPLIRKSVSILGQWVARRTEREHSTTDLKGIELFPSLITMALLNFCVVLYLGMFHQSAPITVSHKISSMTETALSHQEQRNFSVHYLTGACHSTPLHSYLHVPGPIFFDTWSLDCSPDCRLRPDVLCENEQFVHDPVGFVNNAYFHDGTTCISAAEERDQSCLSLEEEDSGKQPPDFLVTFPDYASKLKKTINAMGLVEVGRYSHGINGLRIGDLIKVGDGFTSDNDMNISLPMYRRISLFHFLELSIDEMILYASPSILE